MEATVTHRYNLRQEGCNCPSLNLPAMTWHLVAMAKKARSARHFLKAWRKHRGLNQERLAERIGVTREYISMIERGERQYDQKFLEAAAVALSCSPAELIVRDPKRHDSIWAIWDLSFRIPATEWTQAVQILETFVKKTGTEG